MSMILNPLNPANDIATQGVPHSNDLINPSGTANNVATLERIEQRLLWLSTLMIHHANNVRPNPDKSKIGGHQASAASSASIITALYMHHLQANDRVMIKPHAAPLLHAALYVLGGLDRKYLTMLRQFGGLQSYPSRSKDPFAVDFGSGSMGLGPATPICASLVRDYAQQHFGQTDAGRFIAMVGDSELDEGNLWELFIDEFMIASLKNMTLILDYNRQGLDRVVPGVRATRLKALFADCSWDVIQVKYGRKLQAAFAREGGERLRHFIDEMRNEEYQGLLRADGPTVRAAIAAYDKRAGQSIEHVADADLPALLSNLGGHDPVELVRALDQAGRSTRPTLIFAYTIKGYGLPLAGDPLNHSALLGTERINELRTQMGLTEETQWDAFEPNSPEGQLCRARAKVLQLAPKRASHPPAVTRAEIPNELNASATMPTISTQEAFGRTMMRLAELPKVGARIVTTAADVSVSTNLGGWINKVGAYWPQVQPDYEQGKARTLNWQWGPDGQHIEFGIAEMNMFTMLGALGLSHEHNGQLLFPIGTVYDPFIARGLDAIIHNLYSGAKFIFVATPSGMSLSPEGGAHQATITPGLGIELPECDYHEPCFALEMEWALMEALRQCTDRTHGRSSFLRLSTKPIDQSLMQPALQHLGIDELRRQVLAGGYVVKYEGRSMNYENAMDDASPHTSSFIPHTFHTPLLHLVTTGVMVPEALQAATYLEAEGVAVRVIHLTSPRSAFDDWQKSSPRGNDAHHLASLIPPEQRHAPILTVHDAASHALGWVGSVFGQRTCALGANKFGQSGSRADVYRYCHIDVESIIAAGFRLIES